MIYLKKFNNLSDYEMFTDEDDYILPNVSYIENNSEILFNPILKLKPDTWYLKYNITEENSKVILYNPESIKTLIVDGKNYDLTSSVPINYTCYASKINLAVDSDSGMFTGTVPSEYFVNNPLNFTLKPLDSSLETENAYICMLLNAPELGGIVGLPLPLTEAISGGYYTYNEEENSISATILFLLLLGLEGYSTVCAVLATINEETGEPTFYDTIISTTPNNLVFDTIGKHNVEVVMKDVTHIPTMAMVHGYLININNNIESIIMPYGPTNIDNYYFSNFQMLKTFVMSNSVNNIGHSIFNRCTSLKKVTLSENITGLNGDPSDVLGFFSECKSLESITLPKNISYIGKCCFWNCTSLTSIRCEATKAPVILIDDYNALDGLPANGTLYYPAGSDYSTWKAELPGWTYVEF